MTKKKKQSKKKEIKKDEVTPRRSVMSLSINGSLDDVLRASVPQPPPPKK